LGKIPQNFHLKRRRRRRRRSRRKRKRHPASNIRRRKGESTVRSTVGIGDRTESRGQKQGWVVGKEQQNKQTNKQGLVFVQLERVDERYTRGTY
jgi:hypothetical protein